MCVIDSAIGNIPLVVIQQSLKLFEWLKLREYKETMFLILKLYFLIIRNSLLNTVQIYSQNFIVFGLIYQSSTNQLHIDLTLPVVLTKCISLSFCNVEQIISNQAGQSVVGSYVYVKIEYPAGFLVALPRIKRCRYAAIYNMFLLLQCQSFGLCMYVYSCYWTKI